MTLNTNLIGYTRETHCTVSSSNREKALQKFDKIWDHGILIEGFKFDHETQRKLDRFKEFLFENLSFECLNDATGPKAKE